MLVIWILKAHKLFVYFSRSYCQYKFSLSIIQLCFSLFLSIIIGQISTEKKETILVKIYNTGTASNVKQIEMGCGMSASSTEPGSSPQSSRSQRQRNVESFQYNQIGNRVRIIYLC